MSDVAFEPSDASSRNLSLSIVTFSIFAFGSFQVVKGLCNQASAGGCDDVAHRNFAGLQLVCVAFLQFVNARENEIDVAIDAIRALVNLGDDFVAHVGAQ